MHVNNKSMTRKIMSCIIKRNEKKTGTSNSLFKIQNKKKIVAENTHKKNFVR